MFYEKFITFCNGRNIFERNWFPHDNKLIGGLNNSKNISEQLDRADAHPYGAIPFKRKNYINKFLALTEGILNKKESDRFLKTVQNLKNLKAGQLDKLNIEIKKNKLKRNLKKGIF